MGVYWNPGILILISGGLIILFEIFRFIMKLVYEGVPLLIKILVFITSFAFLSFCAPITNLLSLISSQEFVFTSPYRFINIELFPFKIGGDIIGAMFVYLKEFLGLALIGMSVAGLYDFISKIINGGWKYIMKILLLIVSIIGISIYPLLFCNNITDILFAYLYELIFIGICFLLFSFLHTIVIRIIKDGWDYVRKCLITIGSCIVIILLAYLLADASIDPKSLKYGVTETISKFVGTGYLVVLEELFLIFIGIIVLETRGLVFKYSDY